MARKAWPVRLSNHERTESNDKRNSNGKKKALSAALAPKGPRLHTAIDQVRCLSGDSPALKMSCAASVRIRPMPVCHENLHEMGAITNGPDQSHVHEVTENKEGKPGQAESRYKD